MADRVARDGVLIAGVVIWADWVCIGIAAVVLSSRSLLPDQFRRGIGALYDPQQHPRTNSFGSNSRTAMKKGIRFLGGAFLLGVLLLIAVGLMVGSKVAEGLQGGSGKDADTGAVHAAATQSAGPDPKPASASDVSPSTSCTADACLFVPGKTGSKVTSPGDNYNVTPCGPVLVASKNDKSFTCTLPEMSRVIAGACAGSTKDGKWCDVQTRDTWVPIPTLTSNAASTAAPVDAAPDSAAGKN